MSDPVQQVLDVSQKLQELRQRLVQLDTERAAIQEQISVCMGKLASTAGGQVMPPASSGLTNQILWALRRFQDRALAPMDIAGILNLHSAGDFTNVRVLLSRMSRDGRVRRVAHGRYMTITA